MFHLNDDCNQKLIQLNDALCRFERATDRECTLVLIPHTPDEPIHISFSGKPQLDDGIGLTPIEAVEMTMKTRRVREM